VLFTSKNLSIILTEQSLSMEGEDIVLPITEKYLVSVMGAPDRILSGSKPAPPGYRNNEAFVYDRLGIYWLRHHNSGLMMELTAVLRPSGNA